MAHVSTDLGLVIQHSEGLRLLGECKRGGTPSSKTHTYLKGIVGAEYGMAKSKMSELVSDAQLRTSSRLSYSYTSP